MASVPDSARPDSDAPNPALAEGIAQFNRGDYYACHDTLEAIWMEATPGEKPFYQGILQIAVGLYHLGNHNWQGAAILLGEGTRRLDPFEPAYRGVAVTALVDCGLDWLHALQQSGPERVAELAAALAAATKAAPQPVAGLETPLPQPHIELVASP